jgi:hypothetical protein
MSTPPFVPGHPIHTHAWETSTVTRLVGRICLIWRSISDILGDLTSLRKNDEANRAYFSIAKGKIASDDNDCNLSFSHELKLC